MKKLIIILVSCFLLTGCSLVKTITAPFKPIQNTLPQQTDKSKAKDTCKGEAKFNEQGDMIYCSKGYYSYQENYVQKERKLSAKERIIQFIDRFWGYALLIGIALFFLCPSTLGFIFGRFFEGTFTIGAKTLKQISSAIQKIKHKSPDLIQALNESTDEDVKIWIKNFKQKNNIK